MSPTQRSLKWLRDAGYLAAVVEKWNPHAKVRNDLFGFIDVLAIKDAMTVGVQVTSGSNFAARKDKIRAASSLPLVLMAGWIVELHGWRKLKGRWTLRREIVA